MSENVDNMRAAYDAFGRGDMDGVTENWNDDIRWEGSNFEGLPGAGTHEGKDAVASMLGEIPDSWDEFRATPDEFIEEGDTVVVLGHNEARAKQSGEEIKVPFVHVWRMSDGKVSRGQILTDTAVVARALGVS
jgi:uncharacterized protein